MIEPTFQIKKEKETADYGLFVVEPLENGYGHTLGNALRRVLLTSLPGAAITQVKIDGVKHKFSTLEGLKEDVIELILNLKRIRVVYKGGKTVKLKLEKTGPGEIKAGDIQATESVEIINKDLVLGTLAPQKKLKATLWVESGFGYIPADEKSSEKVGVIAIDGIFGPIQRVNYKIEATRVGRKTDLDRLILEIFTDGTIKPGEALKKSAQILVNFFQQVVKPKKALVQEKTRKRPSETLGLTFEEINIPTRVANALRKGGFEAVGDLVAAKPTDLVKVKNLGGKSIEIVKDALANKNLSLKE